MSRLDDELKLAFRREQPSADFTARVLARIAEQTKPQKLSLWQRIVSFFQLPTMRWAVVAAAIVLIVVVGVIQYQRSRQSESAAQTAGVSETPGNNNSQQSATNDSNSKVATQDAVKQNNATKVLPDEPQRRVQQVAHHSKRKPLPRKFKTESVVPEGQVIAKTSTNDGTHRNPKTMSERERGEQAKEQLYKALAITSNLLSEARKVAIGGK